VAQMVVLKGRGHHATWGWRGQRFRLRERRCRYETLESQEPLTVEVLISELCAIDTPSAGSLQSAIQRTTMRR